MIGEMFFYLHNFVWVEKIFFAQLVSERWVNRSRSSKSLSFDFSFYFNIYLKGEYIRPLIKFLEIFILKKKIPITAQVA